MFFERSFTKSVLSLTFVCFDAEQDGWRLYPKSNKLVGNSNYNVWKIRMAQAMRKEKCWYPCLQDVVPVEIADTGESSEVTGEGTAAKGKKKAVTTSEVDINNHEKAMHMLMCSVRDDGLPMIQLSHSPR